MSAADGQLERAFGLYGDAGRKGIGKRYGIYCMAKCGRNIHRFYQHHMVFPAGGIFPAGHSGRSQSRRTLFRCAEKTGTDGNLHRLHLDKPKAGDSRFRNEADSGRNRGKQKCKCIKESLPFGRLFLTVLFWIHLRALLTQERSFRRCPVHSHTGKPRIPRGGMPALRAYSCRSRWYRHRRRSS